MWVMVTQINYKNDLQAVKLERTPGGNIRRQKT